MELLPCDVVLVRSSGFVSEAIRMLTRRFGEPETRVSHVGMITVGGEIETAMITEAIASVVTRSLIEGYGGRRVDLTIYRPLNLSEDDRKQIVGVALSHEGERYGYLKIAAHVVDWFLLGANVCRNLCQVQCRPICSWLVAKAYSAVGKNFGVPACAASPDDISDFVEQHPEFYSCVLSKGRL